MNTAILGLIIGFLTAALLGVWHWIVWRELSGRRQTLTQLARQVAFSRDTAMQARDGPCEDSTRLALETNLAVYCEAVEKYEKLRNAPYCYIPARIMGFRPAPDGGEL